MKALNASRRNRIVCISLMVFLIICCAVYLFGWFLDFEYIHCLTIHRASRSRTYSGVRVAELIQTRVKTSERLYWHHCGWCETVYPHAKHFAIKVTVSSTQEFLFDWDPKTNRLLPLTVRTAAAFPELIPPGYEIESLRGSLDGQLHSDQPCRIVFKRQEV